MKKILFCLILMTVISCKQAPHSDNEKTMFCRVFKDPDLASEIIDYIDKNTIIDSIDIKKGFSVPDRYYYLLTQYSCRNKNILKISKMPFIESNSFSKSKFLGYYNIEKNVLVFEKEKDNYIINTEFLIHGIPLGIPDENSTEGLTFRGDYYFISYMIDTNGHCFFASQNPIDFFRDIENDTLLFGCF